MPSPNGTNYARLYLPDTFPTMAMDAALPRGRGARDQGEADDPGGVYATPAMRTFQRLNQFLQDRLSDEDLATAMQLIQAMFGDTDGGKGAAMAGDRSLGRPTYAERFTHSGRLVRSR